MAVDVGGRGSVIGLRPAKKPVPKPTAVRRTIPTPVRGAPPRNYVPVSRKPAPAYKKPVTVPDRTVPERPGTSPAKKPPVSQKPGSKKPPAPPSIDAYLGTDAAYQQAISGGKRALKDYLSELGRRRGESETQFGQTRGSMERDRRRALDEIRDEFASRGLIHSGLFGKEQGNFQEKFSEQLNALEQQQAGLVGDLLAQETNFRRENDLAAQQAKQEALLRRAQKYKIGA